LAEFIEVLIFGFLISSLYALIAVGFTMIFGVAGVFNLAHGAFAIAGAYLAVWALGMGLGLPVALIVAIGSMAILAPLFYRLLIRPIERSPIVVFLVTLLFAVLLEQVLILLFGAIPRTLPPLVEGSIQMLGSRISLNRLAASAIALIVMAALWLFVNRTKMGKAILALSMNRRGAALMGIPTERIILWVWAISGALAAISGLFIGSFLGLHPFEERLLLVIAFSIVVLGGLGSIPGSLWAAFIIGYAETIAVQFAPEARGLSSLVILMLVLALRPQGLLGRAAA